MQNEHVFLCETIGKIVKDSSFVPAFLRDMDLYLQNDCITFLNLKL
jgi:hypothetical protein